MLILHLHASHNAPCFPPKVMNKNCLYIRLGTTVIPRKNEKQRLCKIWAGVGGGGGGANKVNYGRCAKGEKGNGRQRNQ